MSVQIGLDEASEGIPDLTRPLATVDVHHGLVTVNLTVADLQIEVAFGACADPGFIVDSGSLAAKIRQRNQHSGIAGVTLRPRRRLHHFLRF